MKVTLKDIAKKSGFGYGTVARAMSRKPYLIKEATRKKIQAIAQELGYVKNISAQTLSKGTSMDIGIVIPAIFGSTFYNDLFISKNQG